MRAKPLQAGPARTVAYPDRVEEQLNQGNALDAECAFCGNAARATVSREERAQHYQILVACAQCGNEFAAISRN